MILKTPLDTPRPVGPPVGIANSPVRRQRNFSHRTKTGCLTCRCRKKRCDEQRPDCRNCVQLQQTCRWSATSRPNASPLEAEMPAFPFLPAPSPLVFHEQSFFLGETSAPSQNSSREIVSQPTQSPPSPFRLSTGPSRYGSTPLPPQPPDFDGLRSPSAVSLMTSQDIYLCTTIDLMAATQIPLQPSFTYFVQEVNPPIISDFDHVNWARAKMHLAELGSRIKAIEAAILAVQALYKAQSNGLPTTHSLSLYQAGMLAFETAMKDHAEVLDNIFAAAFLLCLFEMVLPEETGSVFGNLGSLFLTRLATWSAPGHLSLRIGAWLTLCHASARRGGNPGILSDAVKSHIPNYGTEAPNLPMLDNYNDAPTSVYDIISAPIFAFFLELQKISAQIANLSHYHRSRMTSADQEEVAVLMADLKAQMGALWQARPSLMQLQADVLRSLFCGAVAEPLITLIGITTAAYWTEIVEYGRTPSDPPLASPEAKHAMNQIRDIVDGNTNGYTAGKLNSGYLRPLLLYAIESVNPADVQWAVERIKQIRNPISRSDFFATFAESHAEAQSSKGRRVTTKYFCYQTFGVAPPFL
ncbi:hypothetical protein EDD37DRAFT_635175 [Exophiala viscosa]|uniref:Zn(2)-C6 fungal-type domain-containing protein n=1 Tax=Exophiala viscosa TaxID=2486360 RepID=A0AAN6IEB9_9EURO|nr:hypothetical protein EDD36DRAFT_211686 [Exophiala viscosa]KAI1622481.1 hypothetical protein EDD37DRAFT_635175 [Exophiala viscosa]